ncbi:hypothetical protein [Streptomyces marispadix]|uniref:Large membrane protein n=1 Tax=Streptomyces marispadix TaxID=2922868 RepID=A0ABS9SUA1_9ACTN|nr:hypothetical protein [Streptomyces marispadix]MCH6159850.1 hypothetical protein [Streptomyces marispadix]
MGEVPVRRRRHRLSVVAVAVAVLASGGGGAWWASTAGSSGGPESASEPPALALDGLAAAGRSGEDGGRPGIAPGEPHPQVYRANGELPEGPDAAAVYRPATVERASVSALAEALGVAGKPEQKHDRWVVGDGEKSPGGTSLTVNRDRMAGNWTYNSGDDQPVMRCGTPLPTVPDSGFAPPGKGPGGEGAPEPCPAMPGSGKGDPVSEKKAKSAVRPLLKTLKLDDAQLDAEVTTGSLRMVTATPEIGGMTARDWNSTFTVDKDGKVVRGHGNLGELRRGPSYPVMSAEETLKHLNKQGATAPGAATGREPQLYDSPANSPANGPAKGEDHPGKGHGKDQPEQKGPGMDGPGKVAPRKALKVTDAEFGLVTRYSKGRPVLVPLWTYEVLLGGDHTAKVAHPAVEPAYLKPSGPARPGGGSAPGSGPGAGSGSQPGSGPDSSSGQAEEPGSGPVQAADSYEADGRTLRITFWGGVCGGYEASADESGKTVKVTVRPKETDAKKVCVKMAKRRTVEIELDKALGGRKVVDATDGDALPHK